MDYFALLGIAPAFLIDLKALESVYFTQQRLFHPDRFVKKSPAERQQALLRSVDINAAYETLKNPLPRAQYLLHLQGIEVGTESDTVKPAQSLLIDTMQWRESIDEADTADALKTIHDSLTTAAMQTTDAIASHYASQSYADMAQAALKLSYLLKSQEAVRMRLVKVKA